MITVADIVALPAFESVELAAPCEGAGLREVRNVGILDCPPDYNEYSVYMPGEFVLTNLGFAYANPLLAEKSLIAMIKRDVAAIAVKTVYGAPISEKVCAESAAHGVPLYVYSGAYHEKVAYQSLDLIQRDKDELDKGRAIDDLLKVHDGDAVRAKLHSALGVTGSTVQCFALALRAGDTCSFYAMLDSVSLSLASLKGDCPAIETVRLCRYDGCILVFVSYGTTEFEELEEAQERCLARASAAGKLHCGVGEPVPLADGDLAVHQAIAAVASAKQQGQDVVRWSKLHLSVFADAARSDRLFMQASRRYRSMLDEHDGKHGTELMRTAEGLVRAYGDVRVVAEQLHQHPNTIRYRMRKAKAVLGVPDESDKSFVRLLGLVFLPVLEDEG